MPPAIRAIAFAALTSAGVAQAHPGHGVAAALHAHSLPAGAYLALAVLGFWMVRLATRRLRSRRQRADD